MKKMKKKSQCRKKLKRGDPVGFFNIQSVGKYQKIEGGSFDEKRFSEKKSHRAENILREYPLTPLNFLDDEKILR